MYLWLVTEKSCKAQLDMKTSRVTVKTSWI